MIKKEPKYCTTRPVNDHLHAVIRSCCVSKRAVPVQTALCMSAHRCGFMGCQHKWICSTPDVNVQFIGPWKWRVWQAKHARYCILLCIEHIVFSECFLPKDHIFVFSLKVISVLFICGCLLCDFMWIVLNKIQLNVKQQNVAAHLSFKLLHFCHWNTTGQLIFSHMCSCSWDE